MTRREFARLVEVAKTHTLGVDLSYLAAVAADRIHKDRACLLTKDEAVALVKYQTFCFNGSIDGEAMAECADFMAKSMVVGI